MISAGVKQVRRIAKIFPERGIAAKYRKGWLYISLNGEFSKGFFDYLHAWTSGVRPKEEYWSLTVNFRDDVLQECLRCHRQVPRTDFLFVKGSATERQQVCRPCRIYESLKGSLARYPERQQARAIFHAAKRKGLVRPQPEGCEDCGGPFAHDQAQAHHEDYSKPLEIVWLCGTCHGKRHRGKRNHAATERQSI